MAPELEADAQPQTVVHIQKPKQADIEEVQTAPQNDGITEEIIIDENQRAWKVQRDATGNILSKTPVSLDEVY